MALDRQSIEKKDFPVGRRGYDPEAVDAHLASLADEVTEFKRSARRRSDTLASSASEQVRAIIEAAESSAAEIQRDADSDAKEIRDEANSEAKTTREQAADQAREHVGKVSEATNSMLERLDAMEGELSSLVESLRTGANRLNADLKLLEGNLAEAGDMVQPRPGFEPEPELEVGDEDGLEGVEVVGVVELEAADGDGIDELESIESIDAAESAPELNGEGAGAGSVIADGDVAPGDDEAEGARLIALNMALNGTPREETARYLSENFKLDDANGLLDEVYASVEG
ncbi:MAG: DivIVA domain-containing protein [Solirubrobacteraceae bacterium]